jgi:SAM-dependent methyltransferase
MGVCGICEYETGITHVATERMFGLGGAFHYFECGRCGCLQLTTPPADLAPYYPAGYYSFQQDDPSDGLPAAGWQRALYRMRNHAQFFGGLLSPLAKARARPDFAWIERLVRHTRVTSLHARMLDVGCGSGWLLKQLRRAGFTRLTGCDPFLSAPIVQGPELHIHACAITDLVREGAGPFDLVMFHHSLEHIPDQVAALRAAAALVTPTGCCLVAVPVACSDAWAEYGTDWVELDAPRHFALHTTTSFRLAAEAAGLDVYCVEQDGGPFEFWGSELYRQGLTLMGSDGRARDPETLFTPEQRATFAARAARANAAGRGGRAIFYCTPQRS